MHLDDAVVVAVTEAQLQLEVVGRQRGSDRVTPLDDRHAAFVEHFGQPEVEHLLHLLEPVDVEVVQHEPSTGVLAGEHERRARDALGDTETSTEPLHERGLAGTELTGEQHDVAGASELGDGCAQVSGGLHCRGRGDDRHAASACLARMKSARIWASGSPPPRNTAAGWNVGMSTPVRNGYTLPEAS